MHDRRAAREAGDACFAEPWDAQRRGWWFGNQAASPPQGTGAWLWPQDPGQHPQECYPGLEPTGRDAQAARFTQSPNGS